MLFRLALHITQNREEAEDIVQETMIKVWTRREQWDTIDNLEAFTTTICRNLALDHLKRMDNRHASLDDYTSLSTLHTPHSSLHTPQLPSLGGVRGGSLHTPHSTAPSPFDHAVSQNRLELVRQIIDSLPEKQRSCVQLRDIESKSYRDIATILGISEEQVKVNIFRARQTIRQRFQQLENFRGKG